MEHRIVISQKEAFELSKRLVISETGHVTDEYTGTKRIRQHKDNSITEEEYMTPVNGKIFRLYNKGAIDNITTVFLEVKWTSDCVRFELEFEDEVPEKYLNRPNIPGWDILT